jgi:hypothetical protein
MIWFFTPYSFEKKLFEAYDNYIGLINNVDDWICLMDGDMAFLKNDFGNHIQEYTNKYPDTGMFICYGSRSPYSFQVHPEVNQDSDSIKSIYLKSDELHDNNHLDVEPIEKHVAGFLMVIKKSTWLKYRDEISRLAISRNILGVDTAISYVLLKHSEKILLMQGLNVFHYFRQYVNEKVFKKTFDVLYVLGTGSKWNNNEIKVSLRSLEKYCGGFGKIFIVGEFPSFLSDEIIHIPSKDIFDPRINADGNIIHKVLEACKDERLSDDFLFINDDHIFMKPINIEDIPSYHKGNIYNAILSEDNLWHRRLIRTADVLSKNGYTTYHYDCHVPMVFNKRHFIDAMSIYDYSSDIGYTIKSLYGNMVQPLNSESLTGQEGTIFKKFNINSLYNNYKECTFLAFNDTGLCASLVNWLRDKFSQKSKWET